MKTIRQFVLDFVTATLYSLSWPVKKLTWPFWKMFTQWNQKGIEKAWRVNAEYQKLCDDYQQKAEPLFNEYLVAQIIQERAYQIARIKRLTGVKSPEWIIIQSINVLEQVIEIRDKGNSLYEGQTSLNVAPVNFDTFRNVPRFLN